MDLAETELMLEALGIAAARLESKAERMKPGAGLHHEQQAKAMRALRAKLHNQLCLLADDDVVTLDVAGLSEAQRNDIRTCARDKGAREIVQGG